MTKAVFSITLASLILLFASAPAAHAQRVRLPIPIKNAKAKTALKEFEDEIAQATKRYVDKLDAIVKEVGAQGDVDEAKRIKDHKTLLETHGISTDPDPLRRTRKILLSSRFNVTTGARLQFLPDKRVFNNLFTYWALHDPQTLLVGARNETSPLKIYKFDRAFKRGVMLMYKRDTKFKKHTITRVTVR